MKNSFIYSITIHLILLLCLLLSGTGTKEVAEGRQTDGDVNKILPKRTTEEEISEVSLVNMPGKKEKLKGDDCQEGHWYGGIGIYEGYMDGVVIDTVIPGYPADKAGLKAGDRFISNVEDIKGTPGTRVDVVVSREGITLYLSLIREKICTE